MRPQIINFSLRGIVVCLFVLVGNASVDLVPCDKTRRVFTNSWGVITDGPVGSNYTQDSHCEWLIKANDSHKFITLSFRSMGTECSYDYVFVYDGDSFRSPLLGSFSGKTEPQKVIASSGYMLVLLYSDTNYVLDGFRAEFSITDCPNNCSNHGLCYEHSCVCESDWGGYDCSKKLCPEHCGAKARPQRGHCEEGLCVCKPGFSGQACSLYQRDNVGNKWHWLSHSEGGLQPRAAHTAVYIESTDSLYVFGGYNLNQILSNLEIYSFKNSTWRDENGQILPDKGLLNAINPSSVAKLIQHAGPDWEQKWGLNSPKSFFRNSLYAVVNDNATIFTRRRQRHSRIPEGHKPKARYGHAACAQENGFVIFGGKLENGSLANDLWFYDVHSRKWHQRALMSLLQPPPLTRHTLTRAGDVIYLFGGSTEDGEFSSRLFAITLQPDGSENWQEVRPRGGKELDVRVVAHSTVYHAPTNSLLVYGGIVAGVARFSKLSDRMFAFQLDDRHWTEIHYTREHLREKYVPRERAFHTANIFGNYLIVFGGYSHRHNKEEICYDNQMYLYHLGCHTWVNPEILGKTNDSRYPKHQGVFAHAATVRNGNTLLLVGGYHGNVNGDLLAYTVPPMIASRKGEPYDPESACIRHRNYGECSADPECGWCSADELCYGRTIGANCTTNLQTTRCPGVCPALGDCHSCLIHGHVHAGVQPLVSASHKLGLGECTWCVQNARCHHKDDNYGVCGLREDSPSQIPGWWGPKGTEVVEPEQCRELDRRPGLTFVKYHHPVNFTQPDHVAIINATTVDFNSPTSPMLRGDATAGGEMVARLVGSLCLPTDWQEMLNVCISYCSATLKISDNLVTNVSAENNECKSAKWPFNETSGKVSVDFESHKMVTLGSYNNLHQQSKMELQHKKDTDEQAKVFTFEYLEPYANGTCSQYKNCLYCLTDSQCGWCEANNECVSRHEDESLTCTTGDADWRYLTLQPSACSNCSNYISCESCVGSGLCQWSIEDAKCSRVVQKAEAAVSIDQCPTPCYKRPDCASCLDQKGRCVWCEATQQCFSFSVYTSEYQFGLCREWLDQAFPLVTAQDNSILPAPRAEEQCKSCSLHTNCSRCLSSLSCGWCYNGSNPMTGMCVQGDFNNPHVNCSEALGITDAKWAYAQCPDVDECGLGLHDCHPQAICTNTDGSFSCHCRKGYIGDGRTSCIRTCYNVCVHGRCQGEPDYACKCDLGWFGDDCSKNCGCNNHSACPEGEGICEECMDWSMGEFCEECKPGSYGNATTEQGCHQCECNGHGIKELGECDNVTGTCYCQDNTEGEHCERCKMNYYGDPRNGKQCYYQCEARGVLDESRGQGISSMQAYSAPWGGSPTRECLWIIKPDVDYGTPIIQLQINSSQLNVTCGENAVYVYDGLPELVDMGSQSALSAVFCTEEALPVSTVESRTGQLTVHYKQGLPGEGFSAMYKVLNCEDNCEPPRECVRGQCVCQEGLVGYNCEEVICPRNCTYAKQQGTCDKAYGRCICAPGWVGPSCDIRANGTQILFTELFNTIRLADNLEHLRKTLPRFGHSLVSDRRGSLWMFGGYSLSHGPLNDIRLFDTRNSTWMQVTVDSTTPDAKMPQGRYFHGADIIYSKQAIYVYGGLTKPVKASNNRTLDDFWQFDIQNQRWGEIEKSNEWPPPLSSHTLTSYRNSTSESLILIGGISPQSDFHSVVWEFRLDKEQWQECRTKGQGPVGIFGHSTVFHAQTNSLYVFGGYIYESQASRLSNKLYMLNYDTKTWTELNELGASLYLPRPRFFHSAVTTDNFMFVMGGRIFPWNISDTLYAYSYNCNRWINLMSEALEKVGPLPIQTYAQAMTIEPDGDAAYIVGGWGSDSQCSVLRLELPEDLCSLWPTRDSCFRMAGCGYCAYKVGEEVMSEVCHSNAKECPLQDSPANASKISNPGTVCNEPVVSRNCSSMTDCASCVKIGCRFCENTCTSNATCPVDTLTECFPNNCSAKNYENCRQTPGCDWNCSKGECVPLLKGQEPNPKPCPQSCMHYNTCASCLETVHCRWSTQLDECISALYQPAYCAGGVCGLVLQADDKQYCPAPCSSFSQCSHCLRHAHCGWCAGPGNGDGVCTEGSNERPMHGTCNDIFMKENPNEDLQNVTSTWHYVRCPEEDECTNGHHNCEAESQRCVDKPQGFECECGPGYKAASSTKLSTGSTVCEPVCLLGCVRGQCVQPNKCQCDFGYVGANCSIQCQCNGHANCEGPDKLDKCLTCYNNTMGAQCEKCKPLFVGDPSDGGQCVPCLEYCHGHTPICVDNSTDVDFIDFIDYESERFLKNIKEGPKAFAKCLKCTNQTAGPRCEDCIVGNFRGTEDHRDPCRPCDCHGHGDTCDPVTGDKCNCKNNTESDACGGSGKNSAHPCWMVQCSKCKEGYLGTPTSGHQCYKQMAVESKMCFDAKPIDECKIKPKPLHPGEMVFFVIQPRFMNVDIRIIIDVTQGNLNVYMSTHDDTYVAYPNSTTGLNTIDLDAQYSHWENGSQKIRDAFLEHEAVGLHTYITITQPNTILAVKNLRDRLVITLPEEYHSLESTRFFLVLQALDPGDSEKKVAYGIVFSRQDQLHIDLFVFFSVFFSCFFLFLAACVVAWKAKQAADVRRARRRHVVEMLHMAKRPFASVTLNLSTRAKPKKSAHCDLRPVAVEPTDDGLAAVATVFVSLPGGQSPCVKLALASSLILLVRQFPTGGRTFLRRRSAHAAPPT
ncbi:multiple epidermal growth factor-like domains protein 8 [Tribolium castaneum]|uniref:multiple epidermal growth factor-like domains protein 8 n=1 Tax=Tribolium castaneum TaxID=7070 RepID=UPI00046C05CB|nr:PREDICTED: multiple epidermal growth factor-like domains protein 8 [Tribolium castaneum]|eukprot:XP_001814936.2 PREDICTED: multiple epidermal growth factor-like domains protein 8 [Tribolium castaneum]